MKRFVDRFPGDTEAKIFHAIIRVANAPPTDLTFAQQKDAAQVLTRLYRQQPKHPGLAHDLIHAFDSPPLANLALDAARQDAGIAPAAPHALHMPSHIFTRLGYWDESIKTNRRSADLEPTPVGKSHPMDYMVYAYLQQGRDDAALAVIKEIGGNTTGGDIAGALGSYNALAMPARFALERDDWKAAASLQVTSAALSAEAAVTHFAKGLGAARSGNVALAKQEVAALEKIVAGLTAQKDAYWPIVVDAQRLAVSAWVAHAEGRHAFGARHPRYHLHFTPTSASWLNQVERFFAKITTQRIRRRTFENVQALETAIEHYLAHHNEHCKPFVWTATADAILDKRTNF